MAGEEDKDGARGDLWAHAIDRAGLGVWDADLATGGCYYSPSWSRMLGYEPGELPDDPDLWLTLLHPDDYDQAVASGERHVAGLTERIDTEMRLRHKDGHWVWVLDRGGTVAWDASGKPRRVVGVQTDITRRKQAEDGLAQINARFRLALAASGTGIWHHDFETRTSFWDARTHGIFGLPAIDGEVSLDQWSSQLHPQDRKRAEREHMMPRETGETVQLRYRMIRADGEIRHLETLVCFVAEFGGAGQFVGTVRDVTEACLREEALARAARHDQLTGLLNRSAFDVELARALESAAERHFAIHYLDLDYFKALNDFAGHAAGDRALQIIGGIIADALPDGAIAARLGGDEFAIICPVTSGEDPATLAREILDRIAGTSFGEDAGSPKLGASIGYALICDASISQADALARADDACYAAKASGRNRCVAFGEGAGASTSGLTAARILSETIDAMENSRLLLYGQQIHILGEPWSTSHRCEVLARLQDRNGRLIPPAAFIPAAERFGMAARLDRWIVRTALERHGHAMRGPGQLVLGFNLSAQTLSDPGLWEFVDREVEAAQVSHSNLVFEITETAAVTNFQAAERFVHAARERHCRVSLDDFGSGLSSFDYLRRFPVDSIKINGDFVENLAGSAFDQAIVRAINDVAKAIGLTVVAEKIEDDETLALLCGLGIRYGQGFFLHRPEPLEGIVANLRHGRAAM
ncbi:EAL domain-containing protein [Aliihoeflea sp. 2WW]|uniref:EAL domain-containing protein n=1 Tax=Aliihoeflea sp. 2WW TaxID=1381123 RepID=UPI000464FCE2|nr:EAL domain-containing protein [Aliihoeflea sp. 2WW]